MSDTLPDLSAFELARIAGALDRAKSLHGDLTADVRARVFAAIDTPSRETWVAARSVVVHPFGFGGLATLWTLVARTTGDLDPKITPTREQIIAALVQA